MSVALSTCLPCAASHVSVSVSVSVTLLHSVCFRAAPCESVCVGVGVGACVCASVGVCVCVCASVGVCASVWCSGQADAVSLTSASRCACVCVSAQAYARVGPRSPTAVPGAPQKRRSMAWLLLCGIALLGYFSFRSLLYAPDSGDGRSSLQRRAADLHAHTTESDGDRSAEDQLRLASKLGIKELWITDHDMIRALPRTRELLDVAGKLGVNLGFGERQSRHWPGAFVLLRERGGVSFFSPSLPLSLSPSLPLSLSPSLPLSLSPSLPLQVWRSP
jgi:hypothetical protein